MLFVLTLFPANAGDDKKARDAKEATIVFTEDVQPILEHNCVACHWDKKRKAKLRLDKKEYAFGHEGVIVPGKPEDSALYGNTTLPEDDDLRMPPHHTPEAYPLTEAEKAVLKTWLAQGADWPDGVTLTPRKRLPGKVDFVTHIQPILEFTCLACHGDKKVKDIRLYTQALALDEEGVLTPGDPQNSALWWTTILSDEDDLLMPPRDEGHERLTPRESALLRRWIEDGANWPAGLSLKWKDINTYKISAAGVHPEPLYEGLTFKPGPVMAPPEMKPYEESIRHTDVHFSMVPLSGGTFTMGSPAGEAGREGDEMKPVEVRVSPFWIGTHEVSWDEFLLWMEDAEILLRRYRNIPTQPRDRLPDAVARPSPIYRPDLSFDGGKDGLPANSMTQFSAKMYTMWLSARTGRFYRLPTAAEWEFAARGGGDGPYGKGITAGTLGEYAWFEENADDKRHPVGKLKPNAFGLYDVFGNVGEWVLDDYDLADWPPGVANPLRLPDQQYNRTVRGGNYLDDAKDLRAAARLESNGMWKKSDPQYPTSVWHLSDAFFVGLRVVRPLEIPAREDISKYWPSAEEIESSGSWRVPDSK